MKPASEHLAPWRPGVDGPWDRAAAAHLLDRAGFGAGPGELDAAVERGFEATLAGLFEPAGHDRALRDGIRSLLGNGDVETLQAWWMALLLGGGDPLGERLALHWHDWFATSHDKVGDVRMMHAQNELFRTRGAGDFRELLHAVTVDPAMLVWLDGDDNRRGHPNENFAREVMELFALGIGNYTERDVLEAARGLTGMGTAGRAYRFRERHHDAGPKTIFGRTGDFDGPGTVDLVLAQPACARHVARGLLDRFLSADVDDRTVDALARALVERDWNVGETVGVLLRSRLFFDRRVRRCRVAGPVELVVRTARALGARVAPAECARAAARMGQALLRPPSVEGWKGDLAWIHAGTWLARHNALTALVQKSEAGGRVDLVEVLSAPEKSEVPRAVVRHLLPEEPGADYVRVLQAAADEARDAREALATVTGLVLTSPEYHLI